MDYFVRISAPHLYQQMKLTLTTKKIRKSRCPPPAAILLNLTVKLCRLRFIFQTTRRVFQASFDGFILTSLADNTFHACTWLYPIPSLLHLRFDSLLVSRGDRKKHRLLHTLIITVTQSAQVNELSEINKKANQISVMTVRGCDHDVLWNL